jgi:phospholipase C
MIWSGSRRHADKGGWCDARDGKSHALDHAVVVLFENRSLDNVLGHLYGPADGKNFDGSSARI